ncbi:hypothetical protein SAMN05421731_101632 [Acinetobacter puyangensis]|uniref:Uncharacterized protein n=1 Tax=Acinetobacter puyangensis TaxID=1096779 RepID=A0A240E6T4_9GAMM|nr:hypothetical protein SAMN05421731_101632 [Acinetobacter puyangensis]
MSGFAESIKVKVDQGYGVAVLYEFHYWMSTKPDKRLSFLSL